MPRCVNIRLPIAKADGRFRVVQVEVGNSVRGVVRLADIDVEVVALGVRGDDDQAGQHPASRGARVGARVEQLRMVVATGREVVNGSLALCCSRVRTAWSAPPPAPTRGARRPAPAASASRAKLAACPNGVGRAGGPARRSACGGNARGIHGRAAFARRRSIRFTRFDMLNRFLRLLGQVSGATGPKRQTPPCPRPRTDFRETD